MAIGGWIIRELPNDCQFSRICKSYRAAGRVCKTRVRSGHSYAISCGDHRLMPYWKRLGVALDEFLNVLLLNGLPEQTISLHAALAELEGERWGCWLCAALNALVQKHHCIKQLSGEPMTTSSAIRAGILLVTVAALIGVGLASLVLLALHIVGLTA